jgi:hypothetical protein
VLKGIFTVNEERENLSLDESVIALKEISSIIDVNKMSKKDRAYLIELILIIDEMEVPVLLNGGEA